MFSLIHLHVKVIARVVGAMTAEIGLSPDIPGMNGEEFREGGSLRIENFLGVAGLLV